MHHRAQMRAAGAHLGLSPVLDLARDLEMGAGLKKPLVKILTSSPLWLMHTLRAFMVTI